MARRGQGMAKATAFERVEKGSNEECWLGVGTRGCNMEDWNFFFLHMRRAHTDARPSGRPKEQTWLICSKMGYFVNKGPAQAGQEMVASILAE